MLDPAYKAEVDTPAVLTSLREFIVPSMARYQVEQGLLKDAPPLESLFVREAYH